jgi:hypothetical protein
MPICGKDPDEVFAYQTPKLVVLKDRKLGFTAYGLKFAIFIYIFVYLVLYKGKHLEISGGDGVYRVTLQYPTENSCNPDHLDCSSNFTSFEKLPYCTQSPEQYVTVEGKQAEKRDCQVVDHVEAFVEHPEGVLLPTRMRRYDQVRGCIPSNESGWTCNGKPWVFVNSDGTLQDQDHKGHSKPTEDYFVSDIERFTLMFDHSFRQLGGVGFDDHDMEAYWLDCPSNDVPEADCTRKSLLCARSDCPHAEKAATAGHTAVTEAGRTLMTLPNGAVGISIKKGDVFALGTLLGLGDVDLDEMGDFKTVFRTRGLVLVVHIVYDNRPKHFLGLNINPWHTPKPHYTYRISTRSTYDFQKTKTFDDPKVEERTIREYNGVRLVVNQDGQLASFLMSKFLVTLTTAMGLLAVANVLTDMIMLNFLPKAHIYRKHKHHQSRDLNDEDGTNDSEMPLQGLSSMTKQEVARRFIEAIECADEKAVIKCFPDTLELLGSRDPSRDP